MTRDEQLQQEGARAFERHEIRSRSDGRWLLQRRYKDGNGWDCVFAAEVISLYGGELYVGGDIDFVVFAHYSDSRSHEAKLRWMGEHNDLGYYVRQKASIGTGVALVDVYDQDEARESVSEWLDDEKKAEADGFGSGYAKKLAAVLGQDGAWDRAPWDDRHELIHYLVDELGHDFMCERYDVGMVLAPRVYYAHAALRRLCDLLDAEQPSLTDNPGDEHVQRDRC